MLENIVEAFPDLYEHGELLDSLIRCSSLKFRGLIADTVTEFQRMNNFCRIFPARNSKLYDKYFSMSKQLSKIIYKVLHSPEIISFGIISN
mmetsp:Transcript_14596/g.19758  ORF Transcript_14596/g.19758 Transcript_14596/m.19758 type:complete len:91 (+) Transcript_14596:793-1065(+)